MCTALVLCREKSLRDAAAEEAAREGRTEDRSQGCGVADYEVAAAELLAFQEGDGGGDRYSLLVTRVRGAGVLVYELFPTLIIRTCLRVNLRACIVEFKEIRIS